MVGKNKTRKDTWEYQLGIHKKKPHKKVRLDD